jgi:flagellar protein FliO/FliZ
MLSPVGAYKKMFAVASINFVVGFFLLMSGSILVLADNSVQPIAVAEVPVASHSDKSAPVLAPALVVHQKINSSSQLANLLGGLLLIVGLIYGLSWFVKRFSQGGFMQNSTLKMLAAMPLGTRERIMLVDVGGKQILLGVTATHINALHVFEQPVIDAAQNSNPVASDFSQKLMSILLQTGSQHTNSQETNSQETNSQETNSQKTAKQKKSTHAAEMPEPKTINQ